MKNKYVSKYLTEIFETHSEFGEWFGYYNYDTLNYDQSKLLCNRTQSEKVKIFPEQTIELGYYDLPTKSWHSIGTTNAFNWQQGAMMQWLPGKGNENKVIYNCVRDGHLKAEIVDIKTGEKKPIDWSIYGLTPDGKKSIALNLERSYWCRAYHYQSVANPKYRCRVAEDDGIFEIDLEANTKKRIVSIQDIISLEPDPGFGEMKHWVEHIMVSPSGKRFVFLHRYSVDDNVYNYGTRICLADIDGGNLTVVKGWNQFQWSHFGWNGDDEFAIYSVKSNKLLTVYGKASTEGAPKNGFSLKKAVISLMVSTVRLFPKSWRRRIKGQVNYYQYYKIDHGGHVQLIKNFNLGLFDIDGHPSFTNDGKYMITDSYPDEKGYRRLIAFNKDTNKALLLGRFYEGRAEGNVGCDLHPKLCKNNDYLVIDTTYPGNHHMIVFKLNWEQIKRKLS